jgi:hypothetical protein
MRSAASTRCIVAVRKSLTINRLLGPCPASGISDLTTAVLFNNIRYYQQIINNENLLSVNNCAFERLNLKTEKAMMTPTPNRDVSERPNQRILANIFQSATTKPVEPDNSIEGLRKRAEQMTPTLENILDRAPLPAPWGINE